MADPGLAQYRDSTRLNARAALHAKYGPRDGLEGIPSAVTPAPGASVLEVGCGDGRFWRGASAWPADLAITLTDQSPGMVSEALANVRAVGRWRAVEARVADVCALPFADASFDVVLALHMLYHAPDPEQAVAEIARVLRPGGLAVASTNGADSLGAIMRLGVAAFGGERGDAQLSVFDLDSGAAILRRHFASVEARRAVAVLPVTDPADIVAYLTSFPPGDGASPAMLARLERVTAEAFAAGGGVFEVRREAGYLMARKDA